MEKFIEPIATTPRVIGIGRIFFFTEDTEKIKKWYSYNFNVVKIVILLIIVVLTSCTAKKESYYWDEYKMTINKKFPSKANKLNDGTTTLKLIEFEKKFDIILPKDFKRFYLMHNGEKENTGYIAGLSLLPIEQIEYELNRNRINWKKTADFNQKWKGKITPENSIKKVYYNRNWIPIISDLTGNYIAIDLDPNPEGKIGQIINFGADEYEHFVIADNFNLFFKRINHYILTNNINDKNLENWGHITDLLRKELTKK